MDGAAYVDGASVDVASLQLEVQVVAQLVADEYAAGAGALVSEVGSAELASEDDSSEPESPVQCHGFQWWPKCCAAVVVVAAVVSGSTATEVVGAAPWVTVTTWV